MPHVTTNADDAAWVSRYQALFSRVQNTILDMPDRKLNSMLMDLHKNNGRLPDETHNQYYAEVTATEIAAIEAAYASAFRDNE